jgi:hypothetical protein
MLVSWSAGLQHKHFAFIEIDLQTRLVLKAQEDKLEVRDSHIRLFDENHSVIRIFQMRHSQLQ